MQAIQAAAEMEVKLKKAEDHVDDLESQLIEKVGGQRLLYSVVLLLLPRNE